MGQAEAVVDPLNSLPAHLVGGACVFNVHQPCQSLWPSSSHRVRIYFTSLGLYHGVSQGSPVKATGKICRPDFVTTFQKDGCCWSTLRASDLQTRSHRLASQNETKRKRAQGLGHHCFCKFWDTSRHETAACLTSCAWTSCIQPGLSSHADSGRTTGYGGLRHLSAG